MRNVIIVCVPHSGSTVISHMVSLMGGHHHGDQHADRDGWRRGEMSWFNNLAWQMLNPSDEWAGDATALVRSMAGVLATMRGPWVVKTVHAAHAFAGIKAAIELSRTDPVWVWVQRPLARIKASFIARNQKTKRGEPGVWGKSAEEMWEAIAAGWKSITADKRVVAYDDVAAAAKSQCVATMRALFSFAEPISDAHVQEALDCFDLSKVPAGHRKMGKSGWE